MVPYNTTASTWTTAAKPTEMKLHYTAQVQNLIQENNLSGLIMGMKSSQISGKQWRKEGELRGDEKLRNNMEE